MCRSRLVNNKEQKFFHPYLKILKENNERLSKNIDSISW